MCYIYFILLMMMSLISMLFSLKLLITGKFYFIEFMFLNLNSMNFEFVMLFDDLALMFMSVVLFISSLVIYYSEDYMMGDLNKVRFIMLVNMFVLSMLLMIMSPNLISILLGWDGLGLVSYCLVIYYQNLKSFGAGMLTALSNRVGDVALLMSIAWMMNFGSWNFIYYLEISKNSFSMNMITLMVILAAMTKSAQIPFSSWLPAAMAAPTPVSSLVHSSTLVTAGVYLLIRFNFSFNEYLSYFLLIIASLTMFMSGMGANFEFDLKKIIALSTLSQLGLMMVILALGNYKLAFFHLLIHALFKALLFMCAGNIIHNVMNCQDIRYMGNMINQLPLTCTYLNLCNWSLCGLPFMSGFYSKDLIAEVLSFSSMNFFIYIIFYVSIGLTVSYSARLSFYTLFNELNFNSLLSISENSLLMIKGMSGLILFVIFSGSMIYWTFFSVPIFLCLSFLMKMNTLLFVAIGIFMGTEISKLSLSGKGSSSIFKYFLGLMWNMPILSTLGVNFYPLIYAKMYYYKFDQGWLELYGSKGLTLTIKNSLLLQLLSLNYLKIYFLMFFLWIIFLMLNF